MLNIKSKLIFSLENIWWIEINTIPLHTETKGQTQGNNF